MRTLLLAPHHDDETLFASFLCLTYSPRVVVCFGEPEANGVPVGTRSDEFWAALAALGVDDATEWPLTDYHPDPVELATRMVRLAQEHWDLVFAPAVELYGHPQHNLVGALADAAFGRATTVEHYMTYTYPPLTRSRSEREVPFDSTWVFRKHAALACYQSAASTASYRHFVDDVAEYLAVIT